MEHFVPELTHKYWLALVLLVSQFLLEHFVFSLPYFSILNSLRHFCTKVHTGFAFFQMVVGQTGETALLAVHVIL
jgi:hypothetical protein